MTKEFRYLGNGILNKGVLGRLHREHGDTLIVVVIDPGPTRYIKGQLLGARREYWTPVEVEVGGDENA